VDEMPDAGSFADLGAGIDDGGFVLGVGHWVGFLGFQTRYRRAVTRSASAFFDVQGVNAIIHHRKRSLKG
jgi:hypothetical protein